MYFVRVLTGLVIQVKAVSLILKLKKHTFFAQVFCTYYQFKIVKHNKAGKIEIFSQQKVLTLKLL